MPEDEQGDADEVLSAYTRATERVLQALQDGDPLTRLKRADRLIHLSQEHTSELSRVRREAIDDCVTSEHASQAHLARILNISPTRVSKIRTTGPKPARALLGSGRLTICVGAKTEQGKRATDPSAFISAEVAAAYELVKELADAYNLQVGPLDIIYPPGLIDLSRPNLVVLTSPRLLQLISQSLHADRNISFLGDTTGWYLEDKTTGTVYRSPSDDGRPCDYAYIGRLPRTDGRGTFLYLAGIHAMGTLGAAMYLAENIEHLYKSVRGKKVWSQVIACHYDPSSRAVDRVEPVTSIYTS